MGMKFIIPGEGEIEIKTIVFDLNGTLTVGGVLVEGVRDRLEMLKKLGYRLLFFSGDTRGDAVSIASDLQIEFVKASDAQEKYEQIGNLDPSTCAAIGNGYIDYLKLKRAKIGVVTLQAEGAHIMSLLEADIVVPSILDAMDLFIDEQRLIATLRH